jgi:aminopeptidase N
MSLKKKLWIAGMIAALGLPVSGQNIDFSKKPLQSERSRSYDALHYRIKINLDLDQKSFAGELTMTLSVLQDGLSICVLDAEEFSVSSVVGEWGDPLKFEQTEKELRVHLPRPYRFGESLSFTVAYRGRDPKIGLRFYEETPQNPRLVASDSWPDHVHHWFPCFDYPNDKVTHELAATVKTGYKVASNGRLVGVAEDKAAGTVTYRYSQDQPHSTYLIVLSAAPYVVVHDSYKTLPLNYWVYPQDEKKALPTYGKTPRMVEFFNRIFDYEYPWAKYDQISVPFGGGAESTSATVMGHGIMIDEKDEEDFSAIGIVSHELAHQWWGDLITLRSWGHAWLNESFGTYSDYLYFRYDKGDEEGAVNLANKLNAYLREASTRYIRPIVTDRYDRPQDMFDSHSYPKGALVLHMLRSLVGEEPFFKTLSHFLHRYAFDAVDTADFIRSVKTVTGQNLDWFFDQWLFKPGHPVFEIRGDWDAARKIVRLKVTQVQDFARGVPVFKMPVVIGLDTPKGRETKTVWIREREETFEFPAETKPLLVRFDVGNVLIKEFTFPKDRDELLYQVGHDDVIGRMWAAAELARFGEDPKAVDGLLASAKSDPFWSVRRGAVESLGKLSDKRIPAILKSICLDPSSAVRTSALGLLGNLKNRGLIEFFKDRFRKETSARAQAEALRALGKTGGADVIPFLTQAASVPSHQNIVKNAADGALKQIQTGK